MLNIFIDSNYDIVIGKKSLADHASGSKVEKKYIEDFRSAAFFALGVLQSTGKKALLVCTQSDIASAYTAFTESRFQKTDINVLVFCDTEFDSTIFSRCFDNICLYSSDLALNALTGSLLIKYYNDGNACDTKDISSDIFETASKYDLILCDQNIGEALHKNGCAKLIPHLSDYGIISTYCGMLNGSSESILCICDSRQFMLDLNSLNCRYIKESFKVIVIGDIACRKWLDENGFQVFDQNRNAFIASQQKSILIISGEI